MDIKKCDNCKSFSARGGSAAGGDFCGKCAKKFIGRIESVFGTKGKTKK